MGLLGFIQDICSRKPGSSLRVLQHLLSRSQRQQIYMTTPDRRELFAAAAALLGIEEIDLTRKIASKLDLGVIERPEPINLKQTAFSRPSDLRRIGAIPMEGPSGVIGIVCVDPLQTKQLGDLCKGLPFYLSTWSAISEAIDESERLTRHQIEVEAQAGREQAQALVEAVLAMMIADTRRCGGSRLELDFTGSELIYRFKTPNNRTGSASLAPALRDPLHVFCAQNLGRGAPLNITLSDGEIVVLSVRSTIVDSVFALTWESRVIALDGLTSGSAPLTEARDRLVVHDTPHLKSNVVPLISANNKAASKKSQWPKVLVLDDNETFAKVLERFLHRMEVEVVHRPSGAGLLETLRGQRPDLVICDVHMPEVGGYEVVRLLRGADEYRELPLIMLTSDADIETEIRLINSGADVFLLKSADPRVLCAHVHRLLVRLGKRREAA